MERRKAIKEKERVAKENMWRVEKEKRSNYHFLAHNCLTYQHPYS
jgi:hypothetical protein